MILLMSKRRNKEKFIELAGIEPESYLSTVFSRVFDSLTSEASSLQDDYNLYYSDEYENFEQFLVKKENLNVEKANEFIKKLNENTHLDIYKKDSGAYGDYSLENFIFSEALFQKLEKLIQNEF